MIIPFGFTQLYAQSDREILLELAKQQAEFFKQQAVTNAKIDKLYEQQIATTLEVRGINVDIKALQKQTEMIFSLIMVILAGIFGLIVIVFWDRRALCVQLRHKVML